MKSLNELSREIYQNAADHGWYDKKRSFGDIVALCHSELSEALESIGTASLWPTLMTRASLKA